MCSAFRKIAFKLALLAGIPVIGALLLSLQVATAARDRARGADAIGSIEDLAELSARMTDTVDALQTERATAALVLGLRAPRLGRPTPEAWGDDTALLSAETKTDVAVRTMSEFLAKLDLARLPLRLRGDIFRAREALARAPDERAKVAQGKATIDGVLSYYGSTNDGLIDAIAALTRLSDDGEVLRALSSLVALMRVQECESRKHAVLSFTFAIGEFAPGLYRYLVTLVTEQKVHSASLESFATADQVFAFRRTLALSASGSGAEMLDTALQVTEDGLDIDAHAWFDVEQQKVHDLAAAEEGYARSVRDIARNKVAESRRVVRYCEFLVVSVVAISLALALAVGRAITRSVLSLVNVAGKVQSHKDFSLRAVKTTRDEVGVLTDAFNEMLTVIQERDSELSLHRANLERLVLERTLELSKRNADMRLVLDTVEQGLATVDPHGRLTSERSRAFDDFFGVPPENAPFYQHIVAGDAALSKELELDWVRLSERLSSPATTSREKKRIQIGDRHYVLAYAPMGLHGGEGALLTVSDVTAETAEAAARERLEKELQLAQKLDGLGQLAAGVAHEINTPMQYVGDNLLFLSRAFEKITEYLSDVQLAVSEQGSASLAALGAALEASKARLKLAYLLKNVPKALHDSSDGIAHVSSIVRALKAFAHVDGDEKTTGDLNQALLDTLVVAQNEYKSVATVETELGALPRVLCFPGRLNQVFLNLIVNAAHAVADAKPESGGKIRVTSRVDGGVVSITITDNGAGIPEAIRSRIFDPFFTTKAVGKGTGQGLSIARSIVVDAHGGTLSFESECGRGTAFTVRLPVGDHTNAPVAN